MEPELTGRSAGPSVERRAWLRLRAVLEGGGIVIATTSLSDVSKTVDRLELIVIIGSVVAGLVVAVGVGWLVRRGLRSIETMAAQADRITVGDLTDRVSPHDPATEVGRLGTALNGMLTRIEAPVAEREASDDGPGVPAGRLPRISDRFYRAAPSGRPGSGLGLAIVAATATTRDGTVTAALDNPHGLRVRLALPAAGSRRTHTQSAPPAQFCRR